MDEKRKKWRCGRKEAGLCLQCGKPIGSRSVCYCDSCADYFNERSQERQSKLREDGVCVSCAKNDSEDGKSRCVVCLLEIKEKRKARTNKRVCSGFCVKCGKHSSVDGNAKCETCCLKHAAFAHLGSSSHWIDLKNLFDQQNGKCVLTGRRISIGIDAEVDHISPKAKGGDNSLCNLQWVHKKANRMKSDHNLDEFISIVSEIYHNVVGKPA
jgi:hypothetical protein